MTTFFKQGLDVTGNVNLTGNITVGGDQNFGDANTDSITFTADITSNIVPDVSNTYDLGLTGQRWRTVYGKSINMDGDSEITGNLNVDGIISATSGDLDIQAPANIALYPTGNVWISQGTKLIFEGTTPDDFEVKLQATTVTADRDIIFPDASGTVAVSATAPVTLSATGDIGVDASVVTTTVQQLSGPGAIDVTVGTVQQLSGPGAIDVTSLITEITTTGADAYTFANGTLGQLKIILMAVNGGVGTVTPTSISGGTTLTFDAVGESITMVYTSVGWIRTAGAAGVLA